jgi:hypothetical protein
MADGSDLAPGWRARLTAPGATLAPLRYPAFSAIWVANLLSQLGSMIQSVAAAWLMTELTRLTEYATALAHAQRLGLAAGDLAGFLAGAPGGLKGILQAERRARREENGRTRAQRLAPREAVAARLRTLPTRPLAELAREGEEFTLLLAWRTPTGEMMLVGELADDVGLLERAAKHLLG